MSTLRLDPVESILSHTLGLFNFLRLEDKLTDKGLVIRNKRIQVMSLNQEEEAINFLNQKLSQYESWKKPEGTKIFYEYGSSRKNEFVFESLEYFYQLSCAIRILTHKDCECIFYFSYNKLPESVQFYEPDLSKNYDRYTHTSDFSILTEEDLIKVNVLFSNLIKLPRNNGVNYNRLLNAVTFFNHAQREHWLNLKITLFFIALESLFSVSDAEISLRISLATSIFLYPKEQDKIKQYRVFEILKNGYSLRSCFLHGSKVDDRKIEKKLQEGNEHYSVMLDFPRELNSIVCDILFKVLNEEKLFDLFTRNEKHLKEFLANPSKIKNNLESMLG